MSSEINNPSSKESSTEETQEKPTLGGFEIKAETTEEKPKDESPTGCCGSCT
ncbi:MAG: hypothetical protein OQL16_08485 [Gammaproteobacteria bacterium]|nr:hypothetical protein [Gammaproteobacteria bacterium]